MEIIICKDPAEAAQIAVGEIIRELGRKPDLVLGLPTGSTPLGTFELLVKAHQEQGMDFSKVTTFNLDEYYGLSADHPQSYRFFMKKHLFDGINVRPENIHFPPAEGKDIPRRCREFEERIAACGGIDIMLLGVGANGHVGLNECTSSLGSRTRLKTLTDRTLRDNARFFGPGEVQPHLGVTMGVGTILDAKRILMVAFGTGKAEAVRAMVEGPVTAFCPASALQTHRRATLLLDEPAASLLSLAGYYRRCWGDEQELRQQGVQ